MENINSRLRKSKTPRNGSSREAPSNTQFYLRLMEHVFEDVRSAYDPDQGSGLFLNEHERDVAEMQSRVRSEGISFLTKTLPSLGKAVDTALAKDSPLAVSGFELRPDSKIPKFLGCLLQQIFVDSKTSLRCQMEADLSQLSDWEKSRTLYLQHRNNESEDGLPIFYLSGEPHSTHKSLGRRSHMVDEKSSSRALACVRQICYAFYKLNIPYDEKVQSKVIADFEQCDRDLPDEILGLSYSHCEIMRIARRLVCRVLANRDPLGITPKHGPGAVATGEKVYEKPVFKRFYRRLNSVYNYDQYFFYNLSHFGDRLQEFLALEDVEAGTAKVVLVPKDSRGPRLISCEPLEYQWIQQGQMALLVEAIEAHWLTRGKVNFTHQTVNQVLALHASDPSKDEAVLVTLDMKEASDRVSLALVRELFPKDWFEALYASRSDSTRLPDGRVIPLKKFAPMGSAVCFPVEALIFWALGVALTLYKRTNKSGLSKRDYSPQHYAAGLSEYDMENPRSWFVYGDDIICNGENAADYKLLIEALGLKLNDSKCCTHGLFRESCGVDAFLGINVTPTKFRRVWCHRLQPDSYPAWVAYSNSLWDRGFYHAAEFIKDEINKICPTPTVMSGCDVNGIVFKRPYVDKLTRNLATSRFKLRFNTKLQRSEIYCVKSRSTLYKASNPGWEEMLRVAAAKRLTALHATHEDIASLDALPKPSVIEADWYALPRRNKLIRGWMALP